MNDQSLTDLAQWMSALCPGPIVRVRLRHSARKRMSHRKYKIAQATCDVLTVAISAKLREDFRNLIAYGSTDA